MKSKSTLIFTAAVLLSVLLFVSAFAVNTGVNNKELKTVQMTGSIKDYKNNEALAGAAIYVDGKKYYSDFEGNFSVADIKPGEYQIKVELISYKSATVAIDVKKDEAITINLDQI